MTATPCAPEDAVHALGLPAACRPAPADTPAAGKHLYTVSVRSLCEFTAKRGDLDRRFTPAATALEGIRSQQAVALRRGPDYETEIPLQAVVGELRVRGRADGFDPRRRCLEEVKAIRGHPDEIPANRRLLHWAQLQTYGALFCRARGLAEISLSLVYVDVASQTETALHEVVGAEDLHALLEQRCAAFKDWARQESAHRIARDDALRTLRFPQASFRPGQRDLATAVYRSALAGRPLLAQAPTGIGKTIGTLFPMLRAMPEQGIDKVAYLTCKGTGRLPALEALHGMRSRLPGQALRVQVLVAKEQGCEHPDKACHPGSCPLAQGFYDRLPAARHDAVARGWLDGPAQREVALRHGICPYHLGQELVRWADVVVGDVNHHFDSNGLLWGLSQALEWRLAVLVDEAHNLVDRARQMYSAELRAAELGTAAASAPESIASALRLLAESMAEVGAQAAAPHAVLDTAPDAFVQALQAAAGACSEHFHQQPLATGPLLQFHFVLQRFARLVESLGEHSLLDVQTQPGLGDAPGSAEAGVTVGVRNVVPAAFLRPRFQALHTAVLFSATLSPPAYARQMLGLPEDAGWIDVPPAFPAEHLVVQVADRISTRWPDRGRSLGRLVDVIARQFTAHPGNYLAFFSSFEYLDQVAQALARRHPGIPLWLQERRMGGDARQAFLDRFQPDGQGIGLAVLGGVFAEGVDLPGTRLIGAFVATLGLPPVTSLQEHIKARLDKLCGGDHGYADLVPAMQRVVQAAGRVLRTPDDRGWLWLLDDRYLRPEVVALLPPQWRVQRSGREAMPHGIDAQRAASRQWA